MPGREPFKLEPRDPVLYFVQRLRDEAHRFAIGSHRQRRKKDIREAGLQEIPGIGPTRKRALLQHFGTLKAIERASVADLEHGPGHQRRNRPQDLSISSTTRPRDGDPASIVLSIARRTPFRGRRLRCAAVKCSFRRMTTTTNRHRRRGRLRCRTC